MKKKLNIVMTISIIFILIILTIIIIVKNAGIELQIICLDSMDNSEKIIHTIKVKEDDFIELGNYGGNDIEILEVNEEMVKISRDAVRYEILEKGPQFSLKTRKYIENVIQEVMYDEKIGLNINSQEPGGPLYDASRYYYYVRFVK